MFATRGAGLERKAFAPATFFGGRAGLTLLGLALVFLVTFAGAISQWLWSAPEALSSTPFAAVLLTQVSLTVLTAIAPLVAIRKFQRYLDLARLHAESRCSSAHGCRSSVSRLGDPLSVAETGWESRRDMLQ